MDVKKDVQNQFGRSAAAYVTSELHREGKDLKKLIEIACCLGNEQVLDIATGGGHTANSIAPFVERVVAVDITKEMLTAASKFIAENGNSNVEFVEGDAENLPFADHSFDLVTCRIAAHHFQNVQKFVRETRRVLKDNGQFLLIDNTVPENSYYDTFYNTIEKIRDYSHYRAWKKSEWLIMLEEAGFTIQEFYLFEKEFKFDSWCKRMRLSEADQSFLNEYILKSDLLTKKKFSIAFEGNVVKSFKGESILLKAVKK